MRNDFPSLGVSPEINALLRKRGITSPTPIQAQAIPPLLAGKDLVAQAQTGTGKTLAFLLPIFATLDPAKKYTQALVITPTRELAQQIAAEASQLAASDSIFHIASLCGGHTLEKQLNQLKKQPQIVIGTPGRILDHYRRKNISLTGISKLVLDEADQMLHLGFLAEMEEILRQTPAQKQIMLFSATIPTKIRILATKYLHKPIDVRLNTEEVTLAEIQQLLVEVKQEEKTNKLAVMLDEYRPYLALIFCHTKQRVIALNAELTRLGYAVDELHGDLSQAKREYVLKRFRTTKLQFLVATDIAGRGLDIEGVTHVFNYDIPHDAESYVHRIGRTGRAGEKGIAITFLSSTEINYLRIIEQGIHMSIPRYKPAKKTIAPAKPTQKIQNKNSNTKAATIPALQARQKSSQKPAQAAAKHSGRNLRSRRKKDS